MGIVAGLETVTCGRKTVFPLAVLLKFKDGQNPTRRGLGRAGRKGEDRRY